MSVKEDYSALGFGSSNLRLLVSDPAVVVVTGAVFDETHLLSFLECGTDGLAPECLFALSLGGVFVVQGLSEVAATGVPAVVSKPLNARATGGASLFAFVAIPPWLPPGERLFDTLTLGFVAAEIIAGVTVG